MVRRYGMRIGISTASFYNLTMIEDLPAVYADWGVPYAEYFLNTLSEYEPDFIALLKARTEAAGLTVTSVHPMSSMFESQLFSLHPRQQADAFRIYEKVLAAGRALNTHRYCMHGAAHLSGAAKNLELYRIAPVFDRLTEMAQAYDIRLTLENVSWCFCREPAFALALLDAMQSDALHFTLDVKQAVRSGVDPFAFVDAVGDRIDAVHCCDYRVENGQLRYVLPPYGDFDFRKLLAKLREKGFDGDVLVEVYSDTYTDSSELRDAFYAFRDQLQ